MLIDVGSSSLGTLKEFSDRITTIKQLTGDEAQEIFVKFYWQSLGLLNPAFRIAVQKISKKPSKSK